MKKLLSLLAAFIFVLAGCGAGSEDKSGIGMVTDTGGINDKSFNQGTWEGLEAYAKEAGVEPSYIETKDPSQYEQNLNVSASKNKVVVAAGFTFAEPMYKAAQANPDTDFVLIDAEPTVDNKVEKLDNVHSFLFKEQEAGYLVGYIAGETTKTNKVGFIGGMQSPPVEKFGYGFIQGVQDANPDATVEYNYTGSFEDVSLGKTTASTMYGKGCDVIFTAAGGVNTGVVEAAKEIMTEGKQTAWVIGVDRDMYEDGKYTDKDGNEKSVILTSAVKNVGNAAAKGAKASIEGKFEGGTDTLSYKEDGIGLPEKNPNLDDKDVKAAKDALESKGDIADTKDKVEKALTITVNGKY